jgi:enoyl-CoA hydratase/carnithine racemase
LSVIRLEDEERVRTITWSRPDVLNAFDTELYDATSAALEEAEADDGLHCVVLTGEGRAFSAGQDLGEMARLSSGAGPRPGAGRGFPRLLDLLQSYPKPLFAAVNGIGVGLGFTILAHCDVVLVAESARLRTPFTQLGVAPEAASSYLFPVRLGWQRAAWALLAGEWMGAEELVASGLALRVCPDDRVVAEAVEVARQVARAPLPSLMATKRLMIAGQRDAVMAARAREDAAFAELLGQPASTGALAEFLGE